MVGLRLLLTAPGGLSVEMAPAPWLAALRRSQELLRGLVEPLDGDQLQQDSYASEWSIAQVLSHLGSSSEIFGLVLDAGLSGSDPPGQGTSTPIWDRWNAKSPGEQATDGLAATAALLERLDSLDAGQRERFHVRLFGADTDFTNLVRMRVAEQAIHTWDVAVALDPAATVAPDAVELLVDTLDWLAAAVGRSSGRPLRVRVSTAQPDRKLVLDITADSVALRAARGDEGGPHVRLPAEALLRLVYGRLDPDHTWDVETRDVDLDELRRTFPGV